MGKTAARPPDDGDLLKLIGRIYDAALEPTLWGETLEAVTTAFDANGLGMFVADARGARVGLLETTGIPQPMLEAYREHYAGVNVWMQQCARLRPAAGIPLLSQDFYPEAELLRSEFYNDYLSALDFHYHLGGPLRYDGAEISVFNVLRPRRAPAFDKQDQIFCQQLMPHLQRAVDLHREFIELRGAADSALEVVDQLALGVMLLDARGRMIFQNRVAREAIDRNDGLTVGRDGYCRAALADESALLRQLIGGAARTGDGQGTAAGGAVRISRPSGLRPFALLIAPLRYSPFDLGASRSAAAIFISDPEVRHEPPAELLTRLYGLTGKEARLAAALLAGENLKQAAAELEIAEWTARDYLKAIFRKTGTRRQSELITLLLTGPAALRRAPP